MRIPCDRTALTTAAGVIIAMRGIADFRRNLRQQTRRYWNEVDSHMDFVIGMSNAIDRGFRQAWRAGAAECGIRPQDYSDAEIAELQRRINDQFPFITALATDFSDELRSSDGKLLSLYGRLELWVARYEEIRNQAKVMACKNAPLEWVLGIAEHCKSCRKLEGKVKRASFWQESGILPRRAGADYLECNGYKCQCSLVRTDKPITPGPLPRLP